MNVNEAINEFSTLRDFIRWGVTHFNAADLEYRHGTDNSWDEAVNLVLSLVSLPPDTDPSVLDAKLTEKEKVLVADKIKKRVEDRIPVPYLINEAWFAGLSFYVDERVIIPRSPIAELLEEDFNPWLEAGEVKHVLDLCTGCGCIAISSALTFQNAIVDATDLSLDALEVARVNIERYGLEENVNLIESDVFENLPPKKYDLIISNPPYVDRQEYKNLPKEYQHEPQMALEAGSDGLDIVRKILKQAEDYLHPNGILVVEVGYLQDLLEAQFPSVPFTWLQFERGGEGVFLLTANECREFQKSLQQGAA